VFYVSLKQTTGGRRMRFKAMDFRSGSKLRQLLARRLAFAGLALASLALAGCDKCGDPVKFNMPSLPKTCYGISEPQR
jgi:hypothetical protein